MGSQGQGPGPGLGLTSGFPGSEVSAKLALVGVRKHKGGALALARVADTSEFILVVLVN